MLWILPINVPVLLVWIRNLSVHWLTPFSSHHNVLAIMPFLILVETMTGGRMIPRLTNPVAKYITNVLLFGLAIYAAVYGTSFGYTLHYFVNGIVAWLVVVHLVGGEGAGLSVWKEMLENGGSGSGGSGVGSSPSEVGRRSRSGLDHEEEKRDSRQHQSKKRP